MYNAIRFLYPAARPKVDFDLQNDGEGVYISKWDETILGPQPTQPALDAARPLAEAALKLFAIRAERDRRLAKTDYQAMPDYPSPPAGLAAYRGALRDFPATVNVAALSWPMNVNALNWPGM